MDYRMYSMLSWFVSRYFVFWYLKINSRFLKFHDFRKFSWKYYWPFHVSENEKPKYHKHLSVSPFASILFDSRLPKSCILLSSSSAVCLRERVEKGSIQDFNSMIMWHKLCHNFKNINLTPWPIANWVKSILSNKGWAIKSGRTL